MASHPYPSMIGPDGYPKKTSTPTGPSAQFMVARLDTKSVNPIYPSSTPPSKKRKIAVTPKVSDYDEEDEVAAAEAQAALRGDESKPKRARKKKDGEPEEKRLRRFRVKAPGTYTERLHRVKTQRMFLIDRNKTTSEDGKYEEEVFDIAGTTGNLYRVTVSLVPKCSCPDAENGNQCKHIIYVLVNILKAREDLAYQLAFLTTELAEIFANAPVTPQSDNATATETGGHRKPIEGDCPVCVMEFDESDLSEEILWCKGACGNNIHRHCFEQWARTKPGQVKCVYCRTPWKQDADEDGVKMIVQGGGGQVNGDGYVNVAGQLGITGHRDMSTYHPFWVQRQYSG